MFKENFAHDYDNSSNQETVYRQSVRQWVHGPYQPPVKTNEDGTDEALIDFSHLADLSAEERTVALKAERKLFENLCAQ